jgi:hypothetical protein
MKGEMKLWLITQEINSKCDTYDAAVVAATSENAAREIHPGGLRFQDGNWVMPIGQVSDTWAENPDQVKVKLIGTAKDGIPEGFICCASFNAG